MKTTLNLDERLWARLKAMAARQGMTMSAVVEAAIRRHLQRSTPPPRLEPLPTFASGGALVDVANRDDLYRQMDGR